MRVLNTRPHEQAPELSSLLREAGFEPVEVPAIEVVASRDPVEFADVAQRLRRNEYAWVVLSSANAGRFLDLSLGETPVLCGTATASALGIRASIALDRFSAATALQALQPLVTGGARVLVPRAAEGRDELIASLRETVVVDAPICYRTVDAQIPPWQSVDVVTLCSPSAARALVAVWSAERVNHSRIVCLGATTADAARGLRLRVDAVAQSTSIPALVAAVESVVGASV